MVAKSRSVFRSVVAFIAITNFILAPNVLALPRSGQFVVQQRSAPADLEPLAPIDREDAVALSLHPNEKVAAAGKRVLFHLDILRAQTPAERHTLVQSLPVTILRTAVDRSTNPGTELRFIARGKTRITLFVPSPDYDDGVEYSSGPSAEEPALAESCYDGPPPCATWQEQEDYIAYLADTIADMEEMESQIQEGQPSPVSVFNVSAPGVGCASAQEGEEGCAEEAATALVATGSTIVSAAGLSLAAEAAAASATTLTVATISAGWVGVGVLAAGAGMFTGLWLACVLEVLPVGDREDRFAFEPVLVL